MKFVVLGAGALGSIIAAHLSAAGEEVAVLARGARAAHLTANGITITGLRELHARCPVLTDPGSVRAADVLIVTVKTYDTEAALAPLAGARVGAVLSVQNGVMKNRQLSAVFGVEAVLGATGVLSGEVLENGSVRFTVNESIDVGSPGPDAARRADDIAQRLQRAGISARAVADIESAEWSKFVGWSGMMAAAVLTRLPTHQFLADPDCARIVAQVMRETAALAAKLEVTLGERPPIPAASLVAGTLEDSIQKVLAVGATFRERAPQHRMSALQDLERGRRLEIDETLGYTVREAARLAVPVPAVEHCFHLVRAIDRALP